MDRSISLHRYLCLLYLEIYNCSGAFIHTNEWLVRCVVLWLTLGRPGHLPFSQLALSLTQGIVGGVLPTSMYGLQGFFTPCQVPEALPFPHLLMTYHLLILSSSAKILCTTLAGLLSGEEEIFFPPAGIVKSYPHARFLSFCWVCICWSTEGHENSPVCRLTPFQVRFPFTNFHMFPFWSKSFFESITSQ